MRWLAFALLLVVAGCVESDVVSCADGRTCPAGARCDDVNHRCVTEEQLAVCAGLADGTTCRIGSGPGVCTNGACVVVVCGNGRVEGEEICDDGNLLSGDGCRGDCLSDERCGNGIFDPHLDEECDCGDAEATRPSFCTGPNANTADASCLATCKLPACGDGIIDLGEGCDAGAANSNAADAECRLNCQPQRCGDGIVDPASAEVCDDSNVTPGDGCSFDCQSNETCGNGYVDFVNNEQCDDGNALAHDGCERSCVLETATWFAYEVGRPSARFNGALAYDPVHGVTYLFGGATSSIISPVASGELWAWNGVTWRKESPPGLVPVARYGHALAYDAGRQRLVLYGGSTGNVPRDTWEYDGVQWAQRFPVNRPTTGFNARMAYDAKRKRTVLFGGQGDKNETWEWDGTDWTNVTLASGNPPGRDFPGIAYDPIRGVIVLFGGGANGGVRFADTWTWNGVTWTNVTPVSGNPPGRTKHAMAYDAEHGQVVIAGGEVDFGYMAQDAWAWNGSSWTEISATATPVTTRNLQMAYDSRRDRMVTFGGEYFDGTNNTLLDVTWERDEATFVEVTPATEPAARRAHVAAFDGRNIVVFGGYAPSKSAETLLWDGTGWRNPSGISPPPERAYAAMVYDQKRRVAVLFGGSGSANQLGDTWEWNRVDWIERTPSGAKPIARDSHAMAYDAARDRTVLFGGFDKIGDVPLADTWLWDGAAWTQFTAGPMPPARWGAAMAYDARRGRVVLFGGSDLAGYRQDTWEWDGTTWTQMSPVGASPRPRAYHTLTYDPVRARTLLVGGGGGNETFADIWEWDGTRWTQIVPANLGAERRIWAQTVFDPTSGRIVLIGGAFQGADETWLYRWERLDATPDEACFPNVDADGDALAMCNDPDCWAFCTPSCPPQTTCPVSAPRCGDATCDPIEDCRRCPADCGGCNRCGDYVCNGSEDATSCPGDC